MVTAAKMATVVWLLAGHLPIASYGGQNLLTDEDLKKTPTWKASEPNPPVSAARAIREATKVKDAFVRDVRQLRGVTVGGRTWSLAWVDLCPNRPRADRKLDRWVWQVWFASPKKVPVGFSPPGSFEDPWSPTRYDLLEITVLMDGRVLKPLALW